MVEQGTNSNIFRIEFFERNFPLSLLLFVKNPVEKRSAASNLKYLFNLRKIKLYVYQL